VLRRNDMQRTVRVLRIALPIAIIAFIALLATKWDPAARGKHGVASGPVTSSRKLVSISSLRCGSGWR